jgi:hypothetical protein
MIIAAQPKITLTYSPDKGEFTVSVTETKNVSYTIEYDWHSVDATGAATINTDALTNTKAADAKNKVSDTQVAGTVSSGDTYIHQVLKGILTVSADTLDGKVLNYQQVFKVTDDKKLKIISEQSGTKAATDSAVLGVTTTASESGTMETVQPAATVQPRAVTQQTATTPEPTAASMPMLPIAIGGITLGVGIILGAIWYHQRKKSTITKLTDLPAA